jgi:hypothetical protein
MRDQFIILSLEVGSGAGDIARAVLPDSLWSDYVRVYKKDERTAPHSNVTVEELMRACMRAMHGTKEAYAIAVIGKDLRFAVPPGRCCTIGCNRMRPLL